MAKRESYCSPFLQFVGDGYECWQEDGFHPGRVSCDVEQTLVWGTEIGLSCFNDGGLVTYLEFVSGRTLPEMVEGLRILGCHEASRVWQQVLQEFGAHFPRDDAQREAFVASRSAQFERLESPLFAALERDDYSAKSEAYFQVACQAQGIPPRVYEGP